ncbi:MAG: OB-fold nucleic acid binding domain-containing protein, partial [Pseudomonadales bacterium]|nr:OB-fold nucleic acid binding domain-containing protein [Pseudomonadales bacterium]
IAIVGADFTPGEADQLRRAMAAWKKKGGLEPFKEKLINGLLRNGYSADFAQRIYSQVKGFGEYGFPESHSASFAHIAYVSSWFKYHHPAAFCCALLNSQPMGFYPPAQLIQDARRHGVEVLPVDVNKSDHECTLEHVTESKWKPVKPPAPKLRIGFNQLKDLSDTGAEAIEESRRAGLFSTVQELVYRSGINKRDLEALAAADALRGLSGDRHRAFWQASGVETSETNARPFHPKLTLNNDFGVDVMLPKPTKGQDIFADYQSMSFSLRQHPLTLFREHLNNYDVTPARQLAVIDREQYVKVTGIVTARQRPQTASGVTFLTIEDETGFINVVVWPKLGDEYRPVVRLAKLMGVAGHVQNSDGVIHLIANHLTDLSPWLGAMRLPSRDFM